MSAPWTDEDERAARDSADMVCAGERTDCPYHDGNPPACELAREVYAAIRAAATATERRVLERVAGVVAAKVAHHTKVMERVCRDPEEGDTYRDHCAQRDALTTLAAALAAAFPSWPRATGGGGQ